MYLSRNGSWHSLQYSKKVGDVVELESGVGRLAAGRPFEGKNEVNDVVEYIYNYICACIRRICQRSKEDKNKNKNKKKK